ncbi:glycolate oxidase subunit GlcF [Derxia gummosa]|uniref:Glycolate oxidase iron-sulfur subunit n=1 Tax=Derxia gummosa DSM 723 TaxID=1121388 RepID=A0A8B6X2Y7_9BURK|nr:glycolate oxidase subunit GlcF [Derxia gummosa]
MQTDLAPRWRDTDTGREAERVLRACVHCGFCTATCPTYQTLGDELDGPRGRIYLIKAVLEGKAPTEATRDHLDRCLTCRACETTCPSGVEYHKLVDIGRAVVEAEVPRPLGQRLVRKALGWGLSDPGRFGAGLALGRLAKPLLPARLADKIPADVPAAGAWPPLRHARRMLALAGCVQPVLGPDINAAAARLLDRLGISLEVAPSAGCCGALKFHLNEQDAALAQMRANIDAWWPAVQAGVDAIVITASGCGAQVKDYGHLLRGDAAYAEKAARISELCRDPAEVLLAERAGLSALLKAAGQGGAASAGSGAGAGAVGPSPAAFGAPVTIDGRDIRRVAFQSPCTLQHGLKVRGVVESLLSDAGFELLPVAEGHLCCGSAGTYSLLQPEISVALRERKLGNLQACGPDVIASANLGCMTHLGPKAGVPVLHWVSLLDQRLARSA